MKTRFTTALAVLACAALAAPAGAATRFTIRGAGFGHGVGMSQWGAYGYAMHGATYADILAHYYTGTALGTAASQTVRVLLVPSVARARFSGATAAAGKTLDPGTTYGVRRGKAAGTVDLLSPSGRKLETATAPLRVAGPGSVSVAGLGGYRGSLEISPSGIFGVQVVNAVPLESYVRGVVSRESPSSWPMAALEAQAVAARTYAVTTSKGGPGYDQFDDTRSQVYGGMAAETPSTDAAVAATAGQVVTYQGQPVVTYFFSTSGGRTENVENTALGSEPLPWLRSVDDPYDDASPRHRWGPYRSTLKQVARKLRGLVQGSFQGIRVLQRGASPRIVRAAIVGSGGDTPVSGSLLRARLGLYDTWAYFTSITTGQQKTPPPASPTGGASPDPESRAAAVIARRLTGRVLPAPRGSEVTIQQRQSHGWLTVGTAQTDRRGRYAFSVARPGLYRVRFLLDAGPAVRVR